jgi:hypothetical protein
MKQEETRMGMGMMQDMMQNMMKGMGGMPDICMKMMQQMAGSVTETAGIAFFATPEIRGLFEEWARALEEEIIAFVKEKQRTSPPDIAAKLKISEESVLFFIGKMAREGKLIIGEIRVSK